MGNSREELQRILTAYLSLLADSEIRFLVAFVKKFFHLEDEEV